MKFYSKKFVFVFLIFFTADIANASTIETELESISLSLQSSLKESNEDWGKLNPEQNPFMVKYKKIVNDKIKFSIDGRELPLFFKSTRNNNSEYLIAYCVGELSFRGTRDLVIFSGVLLDSDTQLKCKVRVKNDAAGRASAYVVREVGYCLISADASNKALVKCGANE